MQNVSISIASRVPHRSACIDSQHIHRICITHQDGQLKWWQALQLTRFMLGIYMSISTHTYHFSKELSLVPTSARPSSIKASNCWWSRPLLTEVVTFAHIQTTDWMVKLLTSFMGEVLIWSQAENWSGVHTQAFHWGRSSTNFWQRLKWWLLSFYGSCICNRGWRLKYYSHWSEWQSEVHWLL